MKVKYIGKSFGVDGLFDGGVYEVLEVDELTGALRIIDESGEKCGYLYNPLDPKPCFGKSVGGRFEIVEDDESGTLKKAIYP